MGKCAFLHTNLAAGLTAVGSTTATGLGYSRFNDAQPSVRVRLNASASNVNFRFDFSSNQSFDVAALIGTDIVTADTVRFRASKTDATVVSALECDITVSSPGTAGTNGNIIVLTSGTISARYVRWDVTLAAGTTRDVGLAPVGLLFRPTYNFQFGAQEGRIDLSKTVLNEDTGARFAIPGPLLRSRIITLPALTDTEINADIVSMDRLAGAARDVLFIKDVAANAANAARDSIWGPFREIGGNDLATRTGVRTYARSFKLSERI